MGMIRLLYTNGVHVETNIFRLYTRGVVVCMYGVHMDINCVHVNKGYKFLVWME